MAVDFDLVCFSHLRWDFVFQRPQHLLTRCAKERNVWFVEEPLFGATSSQLDIKQADGVYVVVPHLPEDCSAEQACDLQRQLLDVLLARRIRSALGLWYYTPMALPFTRHLQPALTVYDCMDELANFKGAPPVMGQLERELFSRADLVFAGGHSLYKHKRSHHPRLYCFPSSVEVSHFAAARRLGGGEEPADQAAIPYPRLGFFGVIDERMDLDLIAAVAKARPGWQLVMLGPVAKIDPASLPRLANIRWLGAKTYKELPRYVSGWDVALLPFACNDATRFISPKKTPEYLAAGKPVVATPSRMSSILMLISVLYPSPPPPRSSSPRSRARSGIRDRLGSSKPTIGSPTSPGIEPGLRWPDSLTKWSLGNRSLHPLSPPPLLSRAQCRFPGITQRSAG